ncbi:MAG: antitoxin Xre/MbcA/ParS toxin-binding domain-containing protein [Acidiferrobacteraceae bacterium]
MPGAQRPAATLGTISPAGLYRASGVEFVTRVRAGVPAGHLVRIVQRMGIPKERLYAFLRLPRSTLDRKIRNHETLPAEYTERVLGLERLVGQVKAIVAQSGDPAGFDADRWVAAWLDRPLPALGGARPADFMDTMEGQKLITQLLAQSQSGAYA